ncbi:MAG: NAD(P)/FAD-dependent oxidoreductase [Anaerolineae bacterium]|nr:NAD(P)/FAD-dependent oxidoreductase [Anaerolineae bacterium]
MSQYVIVGNGIAGITAAQAILRADPSAGVHIFGAEPHLYYRRPMLWQYIAGEIEEQALYFRPRTWYETRGIHLHLDVRVIEIDRAAHRLTLADNSIVSYDRLLLATGGRPFLPPMAGSDKAGVYCLRTLKDAQAIKSRAAQVRNAIIIGGGLLGLETARSILSPDRQVTVLEFMPHLLPRQLDAAGADVLQGLLARMGLRIITSAITDEILGGDSATGVRLKDGRTIDGELIVVSAGIRSRTELAQAVQLEVNRGIVVNEYLQTGDPDIWAAGDAAEFKGIVHGIIPAAIEQANVAAANMVEPGSKRYSGTIPSTTLKVVGIDLTCLGNSSALGEGGFTVLNWADREQGVFKKLVLHEGRVTGAILIGDTGDTRVAQQLIESGADISAYQDTLLQSRLDLRMLS